MAALEQMQQYLVEHKQIDHFFFNIVLSLNLFSIFFVTTQWVQFKYSNLLLY